MQKKYVAVTVCGLEGLFIGSRERGALEAEITGCDSVGDFKEPQKTNTAVAN